MKNTGKTLRAVEESLHISCIRKNDSLDMTHSLFDLNYDAIPPLFLTVTDLHEGTLSGELFSSIHRIH